MQHEMKLNEKPFNNIKNGSKRIELRLYDEKGQKLNLNDTIRFYKVNNEEDFVDVKIKGLLRYHSFEELFNDVDFNICGPANNLTEKLENIHKIYSKEEEQKYGILAISMELI